MPAPKKGDPRRPLRMAGPSSQIVGGLCLLLGTCFGLVNIDAGTPVPILFAVVGFFLGTGITFFILPTYYKRRSRAAVITGLTLAGITALLVTTNFVFVITELFRTGVSINAAVIGMVIPIVILIVIVQLVVLLTKSLVALKLEPIQQERGFAVLPVLPVESPDESGDEFLVE